PSRCLTTSVVRLRELTLLTPSTYLPFHFTRNLKFLYGSRRSGLALNWATLVLLSGSDLSRHLLQRDDDELGRFQRREADRDVDDAAVDVVLRGGGAVALDEERVARRLALECALDEQAVHEGTDVEADLRPQRLVVGLEHHPLGAAEYALLDEQRRAPHRNVFPLRRDAIVALQRPRAPHDAPRRHDRAQAVEPKRVEQAVLVVGEREPERGHVVERGVETGGRLPHAALRVGARHHAGDGARRHEVLELVVVERIGLRQPREEHGRVLAVGAEAGAEVGAAGLRVRRRVPRRRWVGQQDRAPLLAVGGGGGHHGLLDVGLPRDIARRVARGARVRRNHEQVEQIGVVERVDARLRRRGRREIGGGERHAIVALHGGDRRLYVREVGGQRGRRRARLFVVAVLLLGGTGVVQPWLGERAQPGGRRAGRHDRLLAPDDELRSGLQHLVGPARAVLEGEVAPDLDGAALLVLDGQVEQIALDDGRRRRRDRVGGGLRDVVVDGGAQVGTPDARARRHQDEVGAEIDLRCIRRVAGMLGRGRLDGEEADDDRLRAAIQKEIAYCKRHRRKLG